MFDNQCFVFLICGLLFLVLYTLEIFFIFFKKKFAFVQNTSAPLHHQKTIESYSQFFSPNDIHEQSASGSLQ
jgi:hypothetical protein